MKKLPSTSVPIKINFDITYNCNAKCRFCSVRSIEKFTDSQIAKKVIDVLSDNNVFRINFFGGEPLLHPDIIELVSYAKKRGMATSMVSNGFLLTNKVAENLRGNLEVIGLSVHGLAKMHDYLTGSKGGFNKVLRALKVCKTNNIRTGVNFTLTKINGMQLKKLADLLVKKFEIDFFEINRFISSGENNQIHLSELEPSIDDINKALSDIDELSRKYSSTKFKMAIYIPLCLIKNKKHFRFISPCGAGQDYCSIHSNGNLKFCSYSKKVLGNILSDDVKNIWNNQFFEQYRSAKWIPQKCRSCQALSLCMVGCKTTNFKKEYSPDVILSKNQNFWVPQKLILKNHVLKKKEISTQDIYQIAKNIKVYPNDNLLVTPSGIKVKINTSIISLLNFIDGKTKLKSFIDKIAHNTKNIKSLSEAIDNLIKLKVILKMKGDKK